jgi:hypothetical protein
LVEILERKEVEEIGRGEGRIILKYIFKVKFYGQHELIFYTNHRIWEVSEMRNNCNGTR